MDAIPPHTAALFPGQGSSLVGAPPLVARYSGELAEHCRVALGEDPFPRAAESTRFAQPAIFLASIAGWRSLGDAVRPLAFAGHSLGELSALAAAGALDERDALDLVILRGALMAEAAEHAPGGGMLAVLKADRTEVERLAATHGLTVANDNAPGQVVLSGRAPALKAAAAEARQLKLRAMALDVAGAFHSPDMGSATEPFRAALAEVAVREPSAPVISGLTAKPFEDVGAELAQALTRPVRWRETMLALDQLGARVYIDVGPDRVLARLAERNLPGCEVVGELVGA
jgi:malonyl CoA-acyl carrier protein transacylase